MKHQLIGSFRDSHGPVTVELRPTHDIRASRDRHRYQRAVEQRKTIGRELAPLGRGPLLDDPAYIAPYSDIDEGREKPYESDEDFYGVGTTFR